MKRISLWLAISALIPGVTQADYGPSFYRVHYSPYRFSYQHSSGLVPGGVRHTPYALSYSNSGLIYDHWGWGWGYGWGHHYYPAASCGHCARAIDVMPCARRVASRPAPDRPQVAQLPARRPQARTDEIGIIRQHLRGKGIDTPNINCILRVDNQLISVDFLLKDRNLLIKYWNPQEIERLRSKESFKQKAYANYRQDWEIYARQHQQAGGEVYYINASDPQTILAALDSCPRLNPGHTVPSRPVLYAKN